MVWPAGLMLPWWDSPRVRIVRLLPRVSAGRSVGLAASVLAAGLLPVASLLAAGAVVGAVPGMVHEGLSSPPGKQGLLALGAMAVLLLANEVAGRLTGALGTVLGMRLNLHLRQRVMRAVNRPAGVGHLDDERIQDLVSRAADGIGISNLAPGDAVVGLTARITAWLQSLAFAALLVPYRWWLAPALLGVQLLHLRVARRDYLRQTQLVIWGNRMVRRSGYFRDLVLAPAAAKEIRLFGMGGWLIERFRSEGALEMDALRRRRKHGTWPVLVTMVLVGVAGFGACALIGWDAAQRAIGLGSLVILLRAVPGIGTLARQGNQDFEVEYGAAGITAVLALEEALVPEGHLRGVQPPAGMPRAGISFRGVDFTYPGRHAPAIAGLDLEVPAGRSLAVVGANGAGKTTVAKLLSRLYDPDRGTVSVDGVDLRQIDAGAWQRMVAAIFQDYTKFELSARDNVGFGSVELAGDLEALERAARRAGVLDLVRALPTGWDTPLARQRTGGVDLSGGEWQRIALARALFAVEAGARVLVLDEPTASLDVRAEAAFYDRFLELTRGLTTILISHRFSTVRRADAICVLEQGRVRELGTHDELLAAGATYARMFRLQAGQYAGEARGPA